MEAKRFAQTRFIGTLQFLAAARLKMPSPHLGCGVEAPTSALCDLDGGGKMGNNSTRRARHNVGAIGQVEGALKTVDLSAMDLRVLDLMRLGKTTKEIAARLRIPERTVALHVRHSLRRLRARSAEELLSLIKRYH